jgi:glycosyltransferase involved in cell wall biosynthesis
MHVVYDYQAFSLQTHGGISRYYSEIAPRIAAMNGCQTTILAGAHRNAYLDDVACECVGFRTPHVRALSPLRNAVNAAFSRAWLSRHTPDLVHETYYAEAGVAPSSCAVVVTVHDMIHEMFPELFSVRDRTAVRKAAAVARADAIICVSSNTRRDLLALLPVDPARVHVVHHGCSIPTARPARRNSDRPFVLFVGPRGGYKNWSRLIRAFAADCGLPSTLDIVCFGARPFSAEELDLVRHVMPGRSRVTHLTGSDDVLAALYSTSAALIYPSLYEGFGLPPLEAMAAGCPVVCSNSSSLPEVFAGAAEMFDPHDARALARAISSVVLSANRSDELRTAGLARARTLSWTRCAEQTREVYAEARVVRDRRVGR